MDNTLNLSTLHAFTYTIKPLLHRPDANGIPLGSIAAHIISTLSVSIEDDKECPGFRFTTLIRRIVIAPAFTNEWMRLITETYQWCVIRMLLPSYKETIDSISATGINPTVTQNEIIVFRNNTR